MNESRSLDVAQDEKFQKYEWLIQRIGWGLWAAIVIAALAGLLGAGPLSHAKSSASDGSLTVRFDRFLHYHTPTVLEVFVNSRREQSQPIRLKLSRSFLDRIRFDRIEPEPEGQLLADDGVVYTFPLEGTPEFSKMLFHFEFEHFGGSSGHVELVGGGSASIQQFVYP
jgi:hypothetical protein